MSTGSDAEWILSRKIAIKSLTRHFAPWKSRFFVLDRANGLLGVRSSNDTMVVINLYSPAFMIQRHEYSVDDKNSITVKYREEGSATGKEIVMKFETTEHLAYWEKALHSAAENVKAVTASSTRALFHSFIDYVNEQSNVRKIVESESQYEAEYYAEGDQAEDPGFLASSVISESEREQFLLEHSRFDAEEGGVFGSLPDGEDRDALAARIRIKPLSIPRMKILLVAVGTRGDMQPFVQLGRRLQQDGHRVRLATHACFRDYVVGKGLEFYPLAGDPLKLSEFMVKTQGFVIPTTPELMMQAPIYHAMVVEMMYSCWGACVDPDPEDPQARKFVADAIISNPVSYAHIHCAEALGIPLHLMFPQPWTPTKAFPHPLSCLSYQQGWSAENYLSYQLVDSMLWLSFERQINAFRTTVLGLEPLRVGNGGWNHLNTMKVPFVKMWSPSFVPKPKDWPSYVDVVGTFFEAAPKAPPLSPPGTNHADPTQRLTNKLPEDATKVHTHIQSSAKVTNNTTESGEQLTTTTTTVQATISATTTTTAAAIGSHIGVGATPTPKTPMSPMIESSFQPSLELLRFLESGDEPVFVGFGSMVVKDMEGLISLFLEGAALAGVRIIVQVGWSDITPERFLELALQAQLGASVVREAENMNDNLMSSGIFPSANKQQHAHAAAGNSKKSVLSGVADLSMSMRSVESTSTCEGEGDESTLDGERLQSVATRESESGMYMSGISSAGAHSALHGVPTARSVDEEFDSSPIPSPPRTVSAEGRRPSGEGASSLSGSQGIGNWLLGAAMNISKTFSQPSTSGKTNSSHPDRPPHQPLQNHSHPHGHPLDQSDISACWDEVVTNSWSATKDAIFLGPCPHDWLFQHVAAVVHHGGAGTTAAGLRYGCPTWICPFFGDQHFWGEMVHRRHVGPKPCPIGALTVPIVADSLGTLLDRDIVGHAADLAGQMEQEDGVEGACQAFYKHLPVENMICDVSLFRGEYRMAQVYCQDCGFKMCNEVSQYLHSESSLHMQAHKIVPCCYKDWSQPPPTSAAQGLIQGLGGLVHELKEGVSDVLYDPVRGIYTQGLSGAAAGLSTGLNSLLSRPMAGGSVLLNKVKAGIQASLATNLHYGVEPSPFDPLNVDDGFAVLSSKGKGKGRETGSNNLVGDDDTAPFTLTAQRSNRIRSLKTSPPDLPAVYSPKQPDISEALAVSAAPVNVPILAEAPVTDRVAANKSVPTSPRGTSTILESLQQSALQASTHSVASQNSTSFYASKLGGDIDSDSDDSAYEEDDAMPFLLHNGDKAAPGIPLEASQELSSSPISPMSETPSPSQPPSTKILAPGAGHARAKSFGRDSLSSAVNHSNDDSVAASSPSSPSSPSSLPPPSPKNPAIPLAAVPGALNASVEEAKEPLSLLEAFRAAQTTHKLFTALGADNGRFISAKEFGKLMQRAVLRETAVRSIDAHSDGATPTATSDKVDKAGSLSAHLPVDSGVLNETSVNALIQMIAHNKRYVDFVDFSLLHVQLAEAQDKAW